MPETVHKLWLKGGKTRRGLGKILVQCGGDKAPESNVHDCQLTSRTHVIMFCCRMLSASGCTTCTPREERTPSKLSQGSTRI